MSSRNFNNKNFFGNKHENAIVHIVKVMLDNYSANSHKRQDNDILEY